MVLRNVTWSIGHSSVNMMVWCYSLIVGDVSVVYLAMVPDCKDIINVSPPYALFCCYAVEQVLLHSSAMNRLALGEVITVSMAVPWTRR